MEKIEEIAKKIEKETDFGAVVELFTNAANEVKAAVVKTAECKGRLLEIVRDLDGFIERELKIKEGL